MKSTNKNIKVRYEQVKDESSQERIDNAFNFIFEETLKRMQNERNSKKEKYPKQK